MDTNIYKEYEINDFIFFYQQFMYVYSILKYADEIQHYRVYFSGWQLSLKCQNTWKQEKIH